MRREAGSKEQGVPGGGGGGEVEEEEEVESVGSSNHAPPHRLTETISRLSADSWTGKAAAGLVRATVRESWEEET